MRKRKQVRHEVRAALSNFELARARSSLTLKIYAGRTKLGELQVGRGSLFWWGRNRKHFRRVGWREFAEKMNEIAYGA